jgi:hypothetical protein
MRVGCIFTKCIPYCRYHVSLAVLRISLIYSLSGCVNKLIKFFIYILFISVFLYTGTGVASALFIESSLLLSEDCNSVCRTVGIEVALCTQNQILLCCPAPLARKE